MNENTANFPPDSLPDAPVAPKLPDYSLDPSAKTSKFDVNRMNQTELLSLHAQIESKLTGIRLSDVNLEKETLLQFQRAKALQEDTAKDKDVPVNQRAQVQNSIAGILQTLSKMQMDLHDSESIKRWKAALIRIVKSRDTEFQAAFFDLIEQEADMVEQELAE